MSIIIVEGPRGVGKTTLSNRIAALLATGGAQYHIAKFERPGDPHSAMMRIIPQLANDTIVHIVDRFHLTEYVMSTYHRRRPSFELLASTMHIDRTLQQYNAIGVILSAPPEVLSDRIAHRNDGRGLEMEAQESEKLWSLARGYTAFPVAEILNFRDADILAMRLASRAIK